MLRLMRRVLAVALVTAVLLIVGWSPAATPTPAPAAAAAQTGTGDFTFDSWHSDFTLGRDADGRSTLTTVETIVARFPDINQNHGLLRAIPTDYAGHPTDLTVHGVTDESGTPRAFTSEFTSDDGNFLELTIADADFVHGAQTYVISYVQSNVTLYPDDSATEQLYWDVNGTGWAQPFAEVSATVLIDPDLTDAVTGDAACYRGTQGSTQPCETIRGPVPDAGGSRVDAATRNLNAHENLTVVVVFQPGTFVPRDDSFTANIFPSLGLIGALLGLLLAVVAAVLRFTRWRRTAGRPTIIAEYLPPKGVNLLTSGEVMRRRGTAMAAQFVSFAVRGNVRILESTDATNHYLLELRHTDDVDPAEMRILTKLFPGLAAGERRDLKKKSATLTAALQKEGAAARAASLTLGLRQKKDYPIRTWLIIGAVGTAALAVGASLVAVATVVGGLWPAAIIVLSIIASLVTLASVSNFRPLTASGAELRDYLKGVKLYIGLAEADRLRVLQSPAGALRSPYRPDTGGGVVTDRTQIVKLSERVLPLAVLFGQEKEWSGVLGQYYEQTATQPDWYVGTHAFSAVYFAGALSTFSTSTTSSWSGTASSSSSSGRGGGGGGGFSGGGGGGGGGGGV